MHHLTKVIGALLPFFVLACGPNRLTFDVTPPGADITYPADGATLNEPNPTVTGTAVDISTIVSVRVNGVDAASTAGNYSEWKASILLDEGLNTITVSTEDEHGNIDLAAVKIQVSMKRAICGDGTCDENENCSNCVFDCRCPNGYSCQSGECVEDSGCGDHACDDDENCETCPADCGDCCGNEECEAARGEDCRTCETDCGCCTRECMDYSTCRMYETCDKCPKKPGEICNGRDDDCDPQTGEEGNQLDCPPGQLCQGGACCTDECLEPGKQECVDTTHYKTCGNYDEDGCLEWSISECAEGTTCEGGECPCTPRSCDDLGHECGNWDDKCGGTIDCGTCTQYPNSYCNAGTCDCQAETCDSLGYNCGTIPDGCGSTIDCGTCTLPETCGGGGTPNICGEGPCIPTTCAEQGIECGTISDGCGKTLECGTCTQYPNSYCNAGTCDCNPDSCDSLGYNCDSWSDGCGSTLECGTCTQYPNSYCNAGTCDCQPETCGSLGHECDSWGNKCGGILECGKCDEPPNKCYQSPGTCSDGVCFYQEITQCHNNDGCCPAGCNDSNDNDCPSCGVGYHLCGETCMPNNSVESCGPRCEPCPTIPNSIATCDGTDCGIECNNDFHHCIQGCVDNCSVENCGDRCIPCPDVPNGTPTCNGVECGFECVEGYHECFGECVNDEDVDHCGTRCEPCPDVPNGNPTCDGTDCGFSCLIGFHECNGSCVDNTSVEHCGTNCTPCPEDPYGNATCDGESCHINCDYGYRFCSNSCVPCPGGPGIQNWTCDGAECVILNCVDGYGLCDIGCCLKSCPSGYRPCGNDGDSCCKWKSESLFEVDITRPSSPFSVVMDSIDSPHFAYISSEDGILNLYYAYKYNSEWVSDKVDTYVIGVPSIALDSNGNPYIAYYHYGNDELRLARFVAETSEWDLQTIDNDNVYSWYLSLVLDQSDHVHIAYMNDDYELMYAHWDYLSLKIQIVDSSAYRYNPPSIVIDSDNNPYISYSDSDHLYLAWTDGIAWETNTISYNRGQFSEMEIDGTNTLHISYADHLLESLKYGRGGPGGWTQEGAVCCLKHTIYNSIAVNSTGTTVHISYYDGRNIDIRYARMKYGIFTSQEVNPFIAYAYEKSPEIVIDHSENPHLFFVSDDNEMWHFY